MRCFELRAVMFGLAVFGVPCRSSGLQPRGLECVCVGACLALLCRLSGFGSKFVAKDALAAVRKS